MNKKFNIFYLLFLTFTILINGSQVDNLQPRVNEQQQEELDNTLQKQIMLQLKNKLLETYDHAYVIYDSYFKDTENRLMSKEQYLITIKNYYEQFTNIYNRYKIETINPEIAYFNRLKQYLGNFISQMSD